MFKKIEVLCIVILLLSQVVTSQSRFDYESELNRSIPIPNSPEAEAFTQYGNTSVNMYAGSPEIGIPIYTHQGRELNLPVNLSYDASGIKVEQLATSAGLGWNLAAGGRISRIANGLPDDYIQAGVTPYVSFWNDEVHDKMLAYRNQSALFTNREDVVDYFDFMNSISINEFDTQPDYFSLNAIGINDYIAFDVTTRQAYALNNPHIIVEFETTPPSANGMRSITEWTITDADGTKYYFEEAELTDYQGNDTRPFDVYKEYNSSWVLTRVESANRRDTYIFNYTQLAPWTQNFSVSGYSSYTYTIDDNTPANVSAPPYVTGFVPGIKISQQRLDNIIHNGKEIVSISYQNRYDIGASDAIDAITIKNGTAQNYKTYDFLTSYFGISNGDNPASEIPSHIRLKLDGIDITSGTNDLYQKYRFEYFSPEQVPPVVSKGQDYMGYYNGQGSNGVLFPEITVGQHTFGGANRTPNFNHAIKGTLSRIYYPTGGYTDFEFESHTTPAETADVNENTHTQIYASQLLTGDIDNNAPCTDPDSFCECGSGWCNDEYGPGRSPNYTNTSFDIQEAGNYTLKYLETNTNGGNVPSGGVSRAYVFKVSNATSCGPAPILDTDQILNPTGNGNLLIDNADVVFNKYDHQYQLNIDGEMSVYLTPGCYQILLVNPNNQITQYLQVSRVETTIDTPPELAEVQRAGIRIKTIKDYTDIDELATEKEYVYKVEKTTNSDSSGNIVFNPQFYTINNGLTVSGIDDGCQIVDATSLFVTGSSSGGSQPHIAYSRVYEIFKKGTSPEDNGGYIQHDFYIDQNTGLHSPGVPPNVSSYRPQLAVGQEVKTKIYDVSGVALQEVSNYLATNSSSYKYFGSFGLYVINKPEKVYDILVSKPYLGGFTYDFQQKEYGLYSTGGGDVDIIVDGEINNDPHDAGAACAYVYPDQPLGWVRHITSYVPSFELRSSSVEGAVGGIVQQVSTQYFGDLSDNKQLQTIEDYEYDNTIGHLLRKKTSTLETDEQITEEYVYTLELTDAVSLQMQARNQLQMPIEMTTTSETAVNTRRSNYSAIGNGFYPTSIEVANNLVDPNTGTSSNNPDEERLYFEYYSSGQIKTSYQIQHIDSGNGPTTIERINKITYVWGYENRYPIARIVNGSYDEVASYVSSLVTLSNADSDRTQDYNGTEGALRQAMDTMRNDPALAHTQITTYTYDPLIGITSTTDPRGYTIYYDYDTLYRLKYAKDSDGNILNENEYNYRINN